MEPQLKRQYFLWDEILKREAELYPWLFLPLIEEISLHSIYSDLVIWIEEKDIYHFEYQMRRDKNMVIRYRKYIDK